MIDSSKTEPASGLTLVDIPNPPPGLTWRLAKRTLAFSLILRAPALTAFTAEYYEDSVQWSDTGTGLQAYDVRKAAESLLENYHTSQQIREFNLYWGGSKGENQ